MTKRILFLGSVLAICLATATGYSQAKGEEITAKWRYEPAMLAGEAIDAGTTVMITRGLSGQAIY